MTPTSPVESLSDHELLAETAGAAADERRTTARLVVLLCEVDARRLYLGQGCSSLFTYCTQVLHLSEHAAYGRIEAARAARRFPLVVERLVSGELTLTGVGLLRSHLTTENHRELLDAARHRSKRDIEELVARLAHHKVPFALGGPTTEENLELRCRSHNGYEAAKYFGRHGLLFVRERPVECQWQLGPDRVGRAQPMRWGTAC